MQKVVRVQSVQHCAHVFAWNAVDISSLVVHVTRFSKLVDRWQTVWTGSSHARAGQGALATAEGRAGGAATLKQRPDPLGRLLGAEPPRGKAKWDFLPALLGVARRVADRQPRSAQVGPACVPTLEAKVQSRLCCGQVGLPDGAAGRGAARG